MKKETIRLLVQAASFALANGYAKGFVTGKIYTGKTKSFCLPGLNCYSCPGALTACPIGALQSVLGNPQYKFSLYVLGIIGLFGVLFGRFICGWVCPFGLIQDLIYRIPFIKKYKNLPAHKVLDKLRYIVLITFVIGFPLLIVNQIGMGDPWFCEYICPSGTLFGGIPLVIANESLRATLGWRFILKIAILITIIILSLITYRPFCKYLCPLGAIYGLFNKVAVIKYTIDVNKCIDCNACQRACLMDIKVNKNPNSMECIRCGRCINACQSDALNINIKEMVRKNNEKNTGNIK